MPPYPLPTTPNSTTSTPIPYRRIVVSFLIAVAAIVILVLYYTLPRATITLEVEPSKEIMETTLLAAALENQGDLKGVIRRTEVSGNQTGTASPAGEREAKASGVVTLVNTTTTPQTLIATTRLLSAEGVLFRLQKTITINGNSRLETSVIADQPGEASAIGPSRFTIPGLKPSLREKIYAEASEPMRRKEKPGSKVTELDLEQARKSLIDSLIPQALAKLREQLPADQRELNVIHQNEVVSSSSSVPAGNDATEFTYEAKIKVTAVFYNPSSLREKAVAKLQADENSGRKIATIEEQSLVVTIDEVKEDLSSTLLRVKFLAQVTVTDPEQAFSRVELIGRTPEEVRQHFSAMPGVRSVEIELKPFWVSSVPTIVDNITLQIKP
ncbi:MAG: hypothetical protein HY974_00010 [Candidatus Kerfeldbacteria bacterium]|nr:hypothetical protein [Candidatus Kerfeldbacteria bacterium]